MSDSKVQTLPDCWIARPTSDAIHELDVTIRAAIHRAKQAGVPQGMVVAIVTGHAHQQTSMMIEAGS